MNKLSILTALFYATESKKKEAKVKVGKDWPEVTGPCMAVKRRNVVGAVENNPSSTKGSLKAYLYYNEDSNNPLLFYGKFFLDKADASANTCCSFLHAHSYFLGRNKDADPVPPSDIISTAMSTNYYYEI